MGARDLMHSRSTHALNYIASIPLAYIVDHIEAQKRQMKEPSMHKLQGQSIQMHALAIHHCTINLDNKKKTQSFMHLHHHTSKFKFNMLLHGQHEMFSADYL